MRHLIEHRADCQENSISEISCAFKFNAFLLKKFIHVYFFIYLFMNVHFLLPSNFLFFFGWGKRRFSVSFYFSREQKCLLKKGCNNSSHISSYTAQKEKKAYFLGHGSMQWIYACIKKYSFLLNILSHTVINSISSERVPILWKMWILYWMFTQ